MIIAGTGHRPSKTGGYSQQAFDRLVNIAYNWLLTQDSRPIIISGMALGWDQALARAAIKGSYELWAYIPFTGQESVWPRDSRLYYNFLLEYASKKIICSTGLYTPAKMQVRNERMVDDADLILAFHNGDKYGGTFNCLKYAEQQKKPIVNLYSID